MQGQDFINLKTHIINLITSKSNKIEIPQIKKKCNYSKYKSVNNPWLDLMKLKIKMEEYS